MSLCDSDITNCNYIIGIRQVFCQSGVRRVLDNIYTNLTPGSTISLMYNYMITYISSDINHVTIKLENDLFIPPITFNILNNSTKTFDLPIQNGSLLVIVSVKLNKKERNN